MGLTVRWPLAGGNVRARWRIAGAIFLQMLPATMLTPVVRPLFATLHGGDEGAMHAFMSLGMLGAVVGASLVGRWIDRAPEQTSRALACLTGTDALLFVALGLPLPTGVVLALRTLEGGAHVAASTLLLAHAARMRQEDDDTRAVPLGGAAILAAVATGSVLGGQLVRLGVVVPFVVGAGLLGGLAVLGPRALVVKRGRASAPEVVSALPWRALAVPLGAAFVERFGIGCMVVSFSLFARARHGLGDDAIGGLYALMTIAFAVTMYPAGRWAERGGARVSFVSGATVYALALAALAFVPTALLAPCMVVAGVASAPLYASALTTVVQQAPAAGRSRAMAAFHVAGCLGMLFGPALAGIVSAIVHRASEGEARHQAALMLGALGVVTWLFASGLLRRPEVARAS